MEENKVTPETLEKEPIPQPVPDTFPLEKRDLIFSALLLLGALILSTIGFFGGFNAGFTMASLIIFATIFLYLHNKNFKIGIFPSVCGILAVILPVSFSITSNGEVKFWSFVAVILLSLVFFNALVAKNAPEGDLGILRLVGSSFSNSLSFVPKTILSLFSAEIIKKKGIGKILLGIALSIPVLLIVVPLLISSDAAFSGLIQTIAENSSNAVLKIIIGIILAPFIISFCFYSKLEEKKPFVKSSFKGIDSTIIIPFLSVISVCYFAYLFSQLAYFFSAFRGFLPDNYAFSLSDYARRGFFEMVIIAVINFAIIFGALLLSTKSEGKMGLPSRLLCLFMSVFTLVIIATALSKMILYIETFGMTRLRITTSAFMLFLAIVFISLVIRLFVPKIKVLKVALITASVTLIALGFLNVNRVIADYNCWAYKEGFVENMDVKTIYELGDEGVPYLIELTDDSDHFVAGQAKNFLDKVIQNELYEVEQSKNGYKIIGKRYSGFDEFNFSRKTAYEAVEEYLNSTK